jgi:hypothetical protein
MIDLHLISEYFTQILGQSGMHHFADTDSLADVLSDCGIDLSDLSDVQLKFLCSHFGSSISPVADAGNNFDLHRMPEVVDNKFGHLTELNSFTHNDTHANNSVRFGESSEVQQYEVDLKRAKNLVDTDRLLINGEESEITSIHGRLNSLSDMANHDSNENDYYHHHSQTSDLESELSSHKHKLEQARADLSIHQAAEYNIQDKIKEALSKRES